MIECKEFEIYYTKSDNHFLQAYNVVDKVVMILGMRESMNEKWRTTLLQDYRK